MHIYNSVSLLVVDRPRPWQYNPFIAYQTAKTSKFSNYLCPHIISRSVSRALASLFFLHLLSRERAELVLDRNNLVRTLLARLDHLAVFIRHIMPCFEDNTALALLGVGAACVGELEWRRAPELKQNIHLVAFVYVHAGLLTTADLNTGQRVDSLGDVYRSAALAGLVRDASDDEIARLLRNTAEVGRLRLSIPSAVEVV